MSEAQTRRISYLRSIVKDRDAEIERLRAALEQIAGCEPYMIGEWAIILARAALKDGG